jgi:hypothetical protein
MLLPAASTDDVTFIQNHTTSTVTALKPRLAQTKQVHASAGPVCTVAPALTGTVAVGQVLTCSTGTWLNSPAFTYQWKRRAFGSSVPIAGATAATYTLLALSSGYQVECEVTATNGGGAVTARSNVVSVP